jgi:hypothetical protein
MKFDFPPTPFFSKLDRESWQSETSSFFSRIHVKYMDIAVHQIQKRENKTKWRQQFLAGVSVLHHYTKGMTINTYIMKSNIQNFGDKYIIYSWYVTKFPSVSASVYWNAKMTMSYHKPTIWNGFQFYVFSKFCRFLKEHGKRTDV